MSKRKPFDKYRYYRLAVQSPETDVCFFRACYRELSNGRDPKVLREDFCATFSLCCEWVKLEHDYCAIGIDLDGEPLAYGTEHYLSQMSVAQQERITTYQADVLTASAQADIICTVNFSYFYLKERATMKKYLTRCLETLNRNGILILDCFGGSKCYEANEEETEDEELGYSYFWDQDNFDPVTNHARFHIHFKRKGEAKRMNVFTYDWRMWSIAEMSDLLQEVGFNKPKIYWEGTDEEGEGNGIFSPVTQGEECEAWICYIIAQK